MARTPSPRDHNPRLTAPASLDEPARTIWRSIVAAVAADHFAPSDVPLLVEFCRAAAQADVAAAEIARGGAVVDGRASPWIVVQEKAQRSLTALAARLRLCPQSRFDRLRAGTSARQGTHEAGEQRPLSEWLRRAAP